MKKELEEKISNICMKEKFEFIKDYVKYLKENFSINDNILVRDYDNRHKIRITMKENNNKGQIRVVYRSCYPLAFSIEYSIENDEIKIDNIIKLDKYMERNENEISDNDMTTLINFIMDTDYKYYIMIKKGKERIMENCNIIVILEVTVKDNSKRKEIFDFLTSKSKNGFAIREERNNDNSYIYKLSFNDRIFLPLDSLWFSLRGLDMVNLFKDIKDKFDPENIEYIIKELENDSIIYEKKFNKEKIDFFKDLYNENNKVSFKEKYDNMKEDIKDKIYSIRIKKYIHYGILEEGIKSLFIEDGFEIEEKDNYTIISGWAE